MAKGLPKSYIKKYGISKEAWRQYRASKSRSTKTKRRSNPKVAKKNTRSRARRYGGQMATELRSGAFVGMLKLLTDTVGTWRPILPANSTGDGLLYLTGALFKNRDARIVGISNGVAHLGQGALGGGLGINVGGGGEY